MVVVVLVVVVVVVVVVVEVVVEVVVVVGATVVVVDVVVVVGVGVGELVVVSSEKNTFGSGLETRSEGKSAVIGDHEPAGVDVSIFSLFLSLRASCRCFLFSALRRFRSCLSSRRFDRSNLSSLLLLLLRLLPSPSSSLFRDERAASV